MAGDASDHLARHERDIDFAKAIGSDRVIFHGGYSTGEGTHQELQNVASSINHYLEYTKDSNLLILVENTKMGKNKVCSDPKHLAKLLKTINHERVGATLDIINLLGVKEEE